MNKEEILIAIKEIQCRYSLPALEQNFTDKDYACKQYERLVIHLANQQEAQDKEIERLNNIIDKAISLLKESGCYDEEAKTFCDDVWDELPDLLNILQGSDNNE